MPSPIDPNYLGNNTYGSSRGTVLQRQPEVMDVHNMMQDILGSGHVMTRAMGEQVEDAALQNEMMASTLLGQKNDKKKKKQMAAGQEPTGNDPDQLRRMYDTLLGIESYY